VHNAQGCRVFIAFLRTVSVLVIVSCGLQVVSARAQEKAYGVRAGLVAISHGEGNHGMFDAFYDVPIGDVIFSPELVVISSAHSEEPAFGLEMMFRRYLMKSNWNMTLDAGAQFVVWDTITTAGGPPKRAHIGVPLRLAGQVPIHGKAEIEVMLTYTPLFFLGAQAYYRSLFGALAGIRILVP
jgi:hypothetical protein